MVAGAPFPDVYDWTWGECLEFVDCREEARINAMRDDAAMYFRHASLLSRMMTAQKGAKFKVLDEFDFLWTDEERKELKREEIRRKLLAKSDATT